MVLYVYKRTKIKNGDGQEKFYSKLLIVHCLSKEMHHVFVNPGIMAVGVSQGLLMFGRSDQAGQADLNTATEIRRW